jgi:hypothetical protein
MEKYEPLPGEREIEYSVDVLPVLDPNLEELPGSRDRLDIGFPDIQPILRKKVRDVKMNFALLSGEMESINSLTGDFPLSVS